jgi:hypothetical protein
MTQKVVFIVKSHEHLDELADKHPFDGGYWTSIMPDGRIIVAAYPRHHHTRFSLADEDGVVVLPTAHDPAPIGDAHKHLEHIDARPQHTGRDIGVMLAAKHGFQFHPDA